MKTFFLIIVLLFCSKAFGAGVTPGLTEQIKQELKKNGFFAISCTSSLTETNVNPDIISSAEKRLLNIGCSNCFSSVVQSHALKACLATSATPDGFVANVTSESGEITVFVSEFQTDFTIALKKISDSNDQTARAMFRFWASRLLSTPQQSQQNNDDDKNIEILDKGNYFIVRKIIYDENKNRRYWPWTQSESVKMAFDKDGHWLILSAMDGLPQKVSSMPPGGRGRGYGSWFHPIKNNGTVFGKKQK